MVKLNEEIKEFVKKQPFTVIITIGEDGKPYPIVVGKNPGAQFVGERRKYISEEVLPTLPFATDSPRCWPW